MCEAVICQHAGGGDNGGVGGRGDGGMDLQEGICGIPLLQTCQADFWVTKIPHLTSSV